MKITCTKENMTNNISRVLKAVSNRTTLPILECILLSADENGFKMLGNDLELGIETSNIEAQVSEQGSVALVARFFSEIVKKLPDDTIEINVDEQNTTTISCGKSVFTIMGMPGWEFPFLPAVEPTDGIEIKFSDFKNMIVQTNFSVAVDESKPVLTGILFEIKDNHLYLVSVDGFRISCRRMPLNNPIPDMKCVIPLKTMNEISKFAAGDGEFTAYITDKHIMFEFDNCKVVSRLIEGEFIKYETMFPMDYTTMITADRQALLSSIERVALVTSKENKKNPINFKIENDLLTLTSKTDLGMARDELNIEQDGASLEISFNPRYLMDALRAIEENSVNIQFSTSLSPCVIKPPGNDNGRYLILPLRLKA